MTYTYQTYTSTTVFTNRDTDAAFDIFWLAPYCPAPDASGAAVYASRLEALWRDAVAGRASDTYLTDSVEGVLGEGVRADRIDWLGLAHSLIAQSDFA